MSKNFIVAANWKLNIGPKAAEDFLNQFLEKVDKTNLKDFIIFPPSIDLGLFSQKLKDRSLGWGPQNIYYQDTGAFTGETSALMCSELGANFTLVGHSERRILFGESDKEVGLKVSTAQHVGLTPIICIGETLEERSADETNSVLIRQLREGVSQANLELPIMVAYEPVWAIGTGQVATPQMAESAHQVIRQELTSLLGEQRSFLTSILYGGSVKPSNATELSREENIDGFLVGGASLDVESLISIYTNSMIN